MIICEKLDEYRKMKLWINELPGDNVVVASEQTKAFNANSQIHWFNGILCLELRIAPRAASNYAMLNLKFQKDQSLKFKIISYISHSDEIVITDTAMPHDVVKAGLPQEYNVAVADLFDQLAAENIFPSGTLEILGGRYSCVGSSYIAFQTVLKILITLFEQNEKLSNSDIPSIALAGCRS